MKKLHMIVIGLILPLSAIAEPKKLVCTSTAQDEAERFRTIAKEYLDPNYTAYDTKRAKELEEMADSCEHAEFGIKNTFTFDTAGLKNASSSKVEVEQVFVCGKMVKDVVQGSIESTPNVITFKYGTRKFNVDRKTLKGGYNTDRDFTCKLFDVDISKNRL